MESYDNYGLNVNKNNKKDDKIELSADERTEFENAFSKELKRLDDDRSLLYETNDLINEALEGVDTNEDSISPLLDNPLERNPLYKQMNDELRRKNILNSDPTGQQQKKSGEDI